MKSVKLSLFSALFVVLLLIQVVPAWAGAVPKKSPSEYGDSAQQVELTTPTFTPISQDGVNISLNSVFCSVDACASDTSDPTGQALSYFFAITMDPGSQINSLTFGPDFNDFAVTIFEGTFTCADGHTCVPGSSDGLNFDTVDIITDCSSGNCIATFLNFNPATIGTGTIIFAAGTPVGSVLNLKGVAQTPLLTANTSATVLVPEPNSVWFSAIAGLVFLVLVNKKKKQQMLAC
jgi:hypothetical protein